MTSAAGPTCGKARSKASDRNGAVAIVDASGPPCLSDSDVGTGSRASASELKVVGVMLASPVRFYNVNDSALAGVALDLLLVDG